METANESVSSPIVEVAGEIIPVASAPPLPPPEEHQVEASSSATPPIPSRPGSKKRALLIGIQKPLQVEPVTNTEGLEALVALVSGTQHQDARSMKQALIELYGYQESDITVLLDRDDHGCTLPTAENILKGIDELVAGAAPGDTFFFHFSSVSTQIFNGKSANGKDNISFNSTSFPSVKAITTCDNMLILNDVLHEKLVKPLPIGSHLIAVFDVCHSASLLDLKHFRCNRVWVPWTNKRKRRVLSALPLPDPLTLQETAITLSIFAKKAAYCDPKPRSPSPKRRNVSPTVTPSNKFSIPQCKHPSTIEEEALWLPQTALALDGNLVRILYKNANPTLHDLLLSVSYDLHAAYLEYHARLQDQREGFQELHLIQLAEGLSTSLYSFLETDKFQNPQISSLYPLDMKTQRWAP